MKFELAFFAMSLFFVGCSSPGRVVDEAKINASEKFTARNIDRR